MYLNTQLEVLNRVVSILQRGDLYTDLFQVEGAVGCEPFVDRFENKLAGWAATFDVLVTKRYDSMLTNTKESLEKFRKFVAQQSRSRLSKAKKNDSKGLYKKLDGVLKVSPNSFELSWDLGYGNFIDKGVSGTEKKYDTPYSYKSKMPPIKPLADWAKRKGIKLRDEKGKFKKGGYKTIRFSYS